MTNAKPSRRARRSPAAARARAESLERRALLSGFISISNATVIEGASITAETSDGTASSLGDYVYKRQQLDFAPFGTRDLSFSVDVVGDTVEEADETFTATLSDPYNASIADGSVGWYGTARGLIVNDDHQPVDTQPPTAVITPVSPDPRDAPVSAATITFSEPVTGVDVSDFTLQQDNGPNLLTEIG